MSGRPTSPPGRRRRHDAGVTLVEMLVVLAMIGSMAGAILLEFGSADRGAVATREAELLRARLNRAVDEAVLSGTPFALIWTERAYRFVVLDDGEWVPSPVALLGATHDLSGGVRFASATRGGEYVMPPSLLPWGGGPLELELTDRSGRSTAIRLDGASAEIVEDA